MGPGLVKAEPDSDDREDIVTPLVAADTDSESGDSENTVEKKMNIKNYKIARVLSDMICAYCGTGGKTLKCPCSGAIYCGTECQKAHWQHHKKECTVVLGT